MRIRNCIVLVLFVGIAIMTLRYYPQKRACKNLNISVFNNSKPEEFNAPIIGILTQSLDGSLNQDEFIAASYTKFIESGGGRVIPIRHTLAEDELEKVFQQINGLMITGGHQKLYKNTTVYEKVRKNNTIYKIEAKKVQFTKYQQTVAWFLERAESAGKIGDYFPIFAVCLGHESLLLATEPNSKTIQRLDTYVTYHSSLPITTRHVYENPKSIWYGLPDHLKTLMQTQQYFYYHHMFGTPKDWYDESKALQKRFAPLTYAMDNRDRMFITSYQHRSLPIFGVQFHPEKNAFEWKSDANRSPSALSISNYLANYFIDKCRRNNHKFIDQAELENSIIYNYEQSKETELFSSIFIIPKETNLLC